MSIYVNTGGPGNNVPSVPEEVGRTFGDMVNILADEVDDTNSEYLSQIQSAIFAAIRFCEREPFYFNEMCDIVFVTVAGRAWYDHSDRPEIATLAGLDGAFCRDGAGRWMKLAPLVQEGPGAGVDDESSEGRPAGYSYFGQRLRLLPTPDSDRYQIRLLAAPARLGALQSDNKAYPWFSEAFDLIKARAKYELCKDILKDAVMATAAFNDFNEQLMVLRAETSRRNGTGLIRATGF